MMCTECVIRSIKKYADITVSMELSSIETTVDAIVEKLKLEKQN